MTQIAFTINADKFLANVLESNLSRSNTSLNLLKDPK